MDEILATQLMFGYTGLIALTCGMIARRLNNNCIKKLSALEDRLEGEISYLDSFGNMKNTEKYRILNATLADTKSMRNKRRFLPIDPVDVDDIEATCNKYCRK